jgi:hypothetical protein
MTPPTPSRPVRITAETPPVDFPCWIYDAADSRAWHRFTSFGIVNDGWVRNGWTYWLPDSPERPTCVPEEDKQPSHLIHVEADSGVALEYPVLKVYGPTPTAPDLPAGSKTDSITNESRQRMNLLPADSPERARLWEAGMKAVYHGAENWRELHQQDLIAAGLLPAPIPVTAPLPASEGTPRTDAKVLLWNLSSRELEEAYSKQRLGVDGRDINGKLVPADFARSLELELAEANRELGEVQKRKIDACIAWTEANDELASLRTLLATAEKERDNLREYVGAQLYMSDFSTADQLRAAYEELRARLTPSASQSAKKRVEECAIEKPIVLPCDPMSCAQAISQGIASGMLPFNTPNGRAISEKRMAAWIQLVVSSAQHDSATK